MTQEEKTELINEKLNDQDEFADTELRCDRCGKSFMGSEDMMEVLGECICPDCQEDSNLEL